MSISIAYFAEKLLTQLPVAALIYSENKRVVWASEQLADWLGLGQEGLIGSHLGELAIEKRKEKPGHFFIAGQAKPLSMHVVQLDCSGRIFACYFSEKREPEKREPEKIESGKRGPEKIEAINPTAQEPMINPQPHASNTTIESPGLSVVKETLPNKDGAPDQHTELSNSHYSSMTEQKPDKHESWHDLGQPKRPELSQFLDYEISRCRRYQNPLSVIKLKFYVYPTIKGQEWQEVSQSIFYFLSERTRWVDMIQNNLEGDFVLVFPETHEYAISNIVNKIHLGLMHLFQVQYPHLTMNFDYGHASWKQGDNAIMLLNRASQSLLEKTAG